MELEAGVRDLAHDAPSVELRHADQLSGVFAVDQGIDAGLVEKPCGGEQRFAFHELELRVLHRHERSPEELAISGPFASDIPQLLAVCDEADGGDEAFALELHHLLHEARTDLTDGVRHRNPNVLEEDLTGVRAPEPDLLEQIVGDAGRVHGHDDL